VGFAAAEVTCLGAGFDDALDIIPEFVAYCGLAVVGDGDLAVFQDADVEFVLEEAVVGVGGFVEGCFFDDLGQGGSAGEHGESFSDSMGIFWVWVPAVIDAWFASAWIDSLDGGAKESDWRCAWDCALLDKGLEGGFDIDAGLPGFFFVCDVDEGFYEAGVGTFGDGIGDGVDDDTAFAEEGFVVGGIIEVASKAGVVPQEETIWAVFFLLGGRDHFLEVFSPGCGSACFSYVFVDTGKDQVVLVGIFLEGIELALNGSVLTISATITKVSPDGGLGRES